MLIGETGILLSTNEIITIEEMYRQDHTFWVVNAHGHTAGLAIKNDEKIDTLEINLQNGYKFRCGSNTKLVLANNEIVRAYDCCGLTLSNGQRVGAIGMFEYREVYTILTEHHNSFYIQNNILIHE